MRTPEPETPTGSTICGWTRLVACLLALSSALLAQDAPRPNVVIIMADDMGWSDLGCYGGEIRTPNIDRLAAEGLRFTHFYNNAKCTTTRASLVTGAYPVFGSGPHLKPDHVTIAEVMKAAGYATALSGKWHLGSKAPHRPIDRGFDDAYGLWDGCCNFFDPAQPDPKFKGNRVRHFSDNGQRVTEFAEDFYTTDAFTDHAIACVKRFAGEKRPFFLHVTYTAPHYPLHAFPQDIAKYDGRYDEGWQAVRRARHKRIIELGLMNPQWRVPETDPAIRRSWKGTEHEAWDALRMETYAAMIDRMDRNIGRLMSALDDAGVARDTLVMFLSDNGGCAETPGGDDPKQIPGPKEFYAHCGPAWAFASNTPFRRYKQWAHEGGIATPLVARWPRAIKADTITHDVGHVMDFLPTVAELAGVAVPPEKGGKPTRGIDGKSLVPVLRGGRREGHDRLFWSWGRNRAVREGKWKLVFDRKFRKWELYDLERDRTETEDLADAHGERVTRMSAAWNDWAATVGLKKVQRPKK